MKGRKISNIGGHTNCWYRAVECLAFGQKPRGDELVFNIKINTLKYFWKIYRLI